MKYRKNRGGVPPFVDEAFADALSGNRESRSSHGEARRDQKTRQLCRQVQRAIGLALSGECGDDLLRDVYVADVVPAPNAGRLAVQVVLPAGASLVDVLQRLERVGPKLRHSVAQAITRKRAPELMFVPMPAMGEVEHE